MVAAIKFIRNFCIVIIFVTYVSSIRKWSSHRHMTYVSCKDYFLLNIIKIGNLTWDNLLQSQYKDEFLYLSLYSLSGQGTIDLITL